MVGHYANSLASLVLILPLCLIFIIGSKFIKEKTHNKIILMNRPESLIKLLSTKEENTKINCSWPFLKLRTEGPVTALASKPGSGNTWVRHLLQLATGIQTGSIFNEQRLKRNGFPGEGITDGTVIAIKTHNLRT